MVKMMRGVTAGGGTASSASAGGHPIAGKTGTVNDHTDVWFIGYTPTYTTGIWMGNPERKENLGNNMTGGHGAVPYFNAFMVPFMKGKPHETFPEPPPMPADIKREAEMRQREEMEQLQEADVGGKRVSGGTYSGTKSSTTYRRLPGGTTMTDTTPTTTQPTDTTPSEKPPVVKPPVTQPPSKPVEKPVEKPAGPKPKGKKGDG